MSESTETVRKRRKVSLACVPCRERKIRCSGEKPVCASCARRSGLSECSYVVQHLDSRPILTESIQSLLDRLQRLENQSQANLPLDREQVLNQSNDTSTGQQAAQMVFSSENPDMQLMNSRPHSGASPNRTLACVESSTSNMIPITQPSDEQHLQTTSLSISQTALVDNTVDWHWKSEEHESSNELVQIPSNEADAMGASSVSDKRSPEDGTQYFGGSSGIGFMRAIRNVLGEKVEDEEFTENTPPCTDRANVVGIKQSARSELMKLLPTFESPNFHPEHFALPSRSLSDALLQNYWTRVYPLYPFVHRPTFEAAYATLWNPTDGEDHLAQESDAGLGNAIDAGPSNQTFFCALNMMLALGSQFLDISLSERTNITVMFERRSKNLLVVDMMDQGSIAIIQTLLLSGQYLQSTFCAQRCWNCIGVACRIAQGLGLHVNLPVRQKDSLGLETRRRVWYACMMLDMSVSMTMGRPLMISHKFSTSPPSPLDDERLQSTQALALPAIGFFLEGINLSKTLSIILTTVYDHNISDTDTSISSPKHIPVSTEIDTLLDLDRRLTKFQSDLPIELRWTQDGEKLRQSLEPSSAILEMQANVLHARFLQSRILLYRKNFIQLCQGSVSTLNDMPQDGGTDSEFDMDNFFVTRCAVTCVASARELIKLVHHTFRSTKGDVWWYSVYYAHMAGMVLKLAQLCNPLKQVVNATYLEESWTLCRETLSEMTSYGQVPRRCLDSLEAIQQKVSHWELSYSKTQSHTSQQEYMQSGGFRVPTSQDKNDTNNPELAKSSPEQGKNDSQFYGRFSDPGESVGYEIPMSRNSILADDEEKDHSNWSADLRDWWNFPGSDFGFMNTT